jgi:hypothetical protein
MARIRRRDFRKIDRHRIATELVRIALVPIFQIRGRTTPPLFLFRIAFPRLVGLLERSVVVLLAGIVLGSFVAHRAPLLQVVGTVRDQPAASDGVPKAEEDTLTTERSASRLGRSTRARRSFEPLRGMPARDVSALAQRFLQLTRSTKIIKVITLLIQRLINGGWGYRRRCSRW